jgi:Tfp pilus assembly protein PilO
MNKESLYKNRHSLIRYGAPSALLLLLYFIVIGPALNRASSLEFLSADKEESSRKFKTLLKQERLIRNDITRARADVGRFREQLHSAGAGEKLIRDVLAFAKEKKVSVTGMEAGAAVKGEFFNEISLKITMEGGFAAQGAFIQCLESAKPAYALSGLSMQGGAGGALKSQFTLKALIRHDDK